LGDVQSDYVRIRDFVEVFDQGSQGIAVRHHERAAVGEQVGIIASGKYGSSPVITSFNDSDLRR
jgi:hypothetical protein